MLNHFLLAGALVLASLTSQAALINMDSESPYAILQSATESEKAQLIENFQQWIQDTDYTAAEAQALKALLTDEPEFVGPEVLEVLDASLISWFYGYDQKQEGLRKNMARLSRQADVGRCKSYQLCVVVNVAEQRIYAYENGRTIPGIHNNPVSTARRGKITPTGLFTVQEIAGKNRRSSRYRGAYLGYAMQIHGHIFIHATSEDNYPKLGQPASAGCIRLHFDVAELLNAKMRQIGRKNIRVVVAAR